jgi:hypothetical protein
MTLPRLALLTVLILALLVPTRPASSQATPSSATGASSSTSRSEAAEIAELLRGYLAHAQERSANERFWAEDVIYTGSTGHRTDKAGILQALAAASAVAPRGQVQRHEAEALQLHEYGDAAVAAFTLVATSQQGNTVTTNRHLITAVFIKRQHLWQAVSWQSTDEAPQAP